MQNVTWLLRARDVLFSSFYSLLRSRRHRCHRHTSGPWCTFCFLLLILLLRVRFNSKCMTTLFTQSFSYVFLLKLNKYIHLGIFKLMPIIITLLLLFVIFENSIDAVKYKCNSNYLTTYVKYIIVFFSHCLKLVYPICCTLMGIRL